MIGKEDKQGLKEIYVVGCGPSLKNFNWNLLSDKTTIAVNGALKDVPNPDYFITADSYFCRVATHYKFWNKEAYKILVMKPDHQYFYRVKRIVKYFDKRIEPNRYDGQIGFDENNFATGQNSGFCGMQLAIILGAQVVRLLGMDFCSKESNNYHNMYTSNPQKWNEFFTHFKTGIKILKEQGIEVISHSPISLLNGYIEYRELYE